VALEATKTFANTASVLYDAVIVPGGADGVAMLHKSGDASTFIDQMFKHGKPIAALTAGADLFAATETARALNGTSDLASYGVFVAQASKPADALKQFVAANRTQAEQIAA
jgi:catalase